MTVGAWALVLILWNKGAEVETIYFKTKADCEVAQSELSKLIGYGSATCVYTGLEK